MNILSKLMEKYHLYRVNKDPSFVARIKHPSEKAQLAAVNQEPFSIRHIVNSTEKAQQAAKNPPSPVPSNNLQTKKESFSANGSIDSYTKSLRCDNGQYQIFDRLTGKSHSLDCGEIDMSKLTGNQVKSLLNGNDVPFGSGQKLSLVKGTGGFALSVGKQVVSLADAEAGL